jgi:hypothetical protein
MTVQQQVVKSTEDQKVTSTIEVITPELAKTYLSSQTLNRQPNLFRVSAYAQLMSESNWKISDPLMFDVAGKLYDGQHRLLSVIKANIPVEFLVIRNMPEVAKKYCDLGQTRTFSQVAQIAGVEVGGRQISMVRQLLRATGDRSLANPKQIIELCLKYKEGFDFSVINSSRIKNKIKSGDTAIILCAVAKAYYYENHARLLEFLQVYHTNHVHEAIADSSAIALRNFTSDWTRIKARSGVEVVTHYDILCKAQKAINLFCQKVNSKIITKQPYREDLYPLIDFLPKTVTEDVREKYVKRIERNMAINIKEISISNFN